MNGMKRIPCEAVAGLLPKPVQQAGEHEIMLP